jgi:hypothetical protein
MRGRRESERISRGGSRIEQLSRARSLGMKSKMDMGSRGIGSHRGNSTGVELRSARSCAVCARVSCDDIWVQTDRTQSLKPSRIIIGCEKTVVVCGKEYVLAIVCDCHLHSHEGDDGGQSCHIMGCDLTI